MKDKHGKDETSESGRRKLISRRQVNSFIRKRFVLVQTRLRANTTHLLSYIYIYIYIDAISTAFNRDDISSFGFHGRVEIADRRGGELVFVEIRNTGYRPREIDWTIALRKQSKFGSRG